jgi:hypothetical protein
VDLTGVGEMAKAIKRCKASLETVLDRHAPLPVAVRVVVTGETVFHDNLLADPDTFKDTLRAEAITAFGERAWIEKVHIRTRSADRPVPEPGPLKELAELAAQVADDDAKLLALGEELIDLLKKLPPEYRRGENPLRTDDPDQLREIVRQAHSVLVRRLRREAAS